MGIGQSKNEENNSMEDIKNLRVDEKTRADTLIIKSIQECVTRIEKLENQKSDKLLYKLPALNLCNASLISINNINMIH